MSMYDQEFWRIVARGLRDPLVVGIVVALLSSPRLQRRLSEYCPLLIGDSVQSTIVRMSIGVVIYIVVRKLVVP